MDDVDSITALWEWLTRDVTIVGGLQSPALSWIGAAGILTLCLWHSAVLLRALLHIQGTLARFHSSVAPLVLARQQVSKDCLVIPALAKKQARLDLTSETRRDLDDLHTLDRTVRSEQDFSRDWFSYRKTLAVEQSPGFLSRPSIVSVPQVSFSRSNLSAPPISTSDSIGNFPLL